MNHFVVLLVAVCMLACSVPQPHAPPASVAQAAVGSGRPEPVRLWQDAGIFSLIGRLIEESQRRILVEVYELGRAGLIVSLGSRKAAGVDVRVITDPTVAASRRAADWRDRVGGEGAARPVGERR